MGAMSNEPRNGRRSRLELGARRAPAFALLIALGLTLVWLAACNSAPGATAQPTPGEQVEAADAENTLDAVDAVNAPPALAMPAANPLPPARIAIPAVGLDAPIEPMGWAVVEEDGVLTTAWVLPENAAGWHVNSAGAGGAGNLVLSGSQVTGAAVFAPLALGDVQPGQDVLVTDSGGSVYTYRIARVSEPLPILGASSAEQAEAAAFSAPTETPQLTLITGWPDFTSTHRVFAVAELVGGPQ